MPTSFSCDGSAIPFRVAPAGSLSLAAGPAAENQPTTSGWARIESLGGTLAGVATFNDEGGGRLRSTAGVFASQPVDAATMAVDNDDAAERYTGVALANPGSDPINIRLLLRNVDGNPSFDFVPVVLNPLPAGCQVGTFLHQLQDQTRRFRGSLVLTSGGGVFTVVALVQSRGQLTTVPVVPGK